MNVRPGPGARQDIGVYFTDRGIEELAERRGHEQVTLAWLAERLRQFTDLHPDFEVPVERLATWLARSDDLEDDDLEDDDLEDDGDRHGDA